MFGGQGFDDKPTNEPRLLNDLWEFDTTKQTWRLIDDVDPSNVKEDSNKKSPIPRPRKLAASCGVQGLVFVVYGGEDTAGRVLNDTWLYDELQSEWLILKFSSNVQQPLARKDMAYWCSRDRLVIFGGVGASGQTLEDMWEFSLRNLTWRPVMLLSEDLASPVDRAGALTWAAPKGVLYLYGGFSIDKRGSLVGLADLWQFDHYNRTWIMLEVCSGDNDTAISGANSNNVNDTNVLLSAGVRLDTETTIKGSGAGDCPGGRRHGASWVEEKTGNLWLFGGEVLPLHKVSSDVPLASATISDIFSSLWFMADLWRFDVHKHEWTWMGMLEKPGRRARYGTNYEPATANHPGARCQMVAWTRKGQMLLYGGLGLDARNKTAFLNDVWLMTHSNISYAFKVQRDWFRSIPPTTVFLVTLGSFGGVVFSFGIGFYLKKMLESPNHDPGEFRVKYSRVRQDTFFDY